MAYSNHSKWLWMAYLISSSARSLAALACLGRSNSDSERSLERHRSTKARLRCAGTRVLLEARLVLLLKACRDCAFSEPSALPSAASLSSSELQTEQLESSRLARSRCSCFFSHLERCPPSAEGTLYSFQQPRQRKVGWQVMVLALYLTLLPFLRLRSKQTSLETLWLCQFLKKKGWGYSTCSLFLIITSIASYWLLMLRWSCCFDCLGVRSSFFGFTRKYSSGLTDFASFFTVPLLAETASFARSSRDSSPPSRSCSNSPKGFLSLANWTRRGLSVELWLSTLRAELSPCGFSGVARGASAASRSKLGGRGRSQSRVLAGWWGNLGLLGLMQMMSSEEE